MTFITTRFAVAALCVVAATTASAQTLYRSVGPDGKVVYSDKPPTSGKLEKTLDASTLPNTALPPEVKLEMERLKREGLTKPAVKHGTPSTAFASKSPASPHTAAPNVVLYTATWCGPCRWAKAHLAQRNVAYREFDIDTPEGKANYAQVGEGAGVPLMFFNGEKVRGFSASAYDELIAKR